MSAEQPSKETGLDEAERLIAEIYRFAGTSAEIDHQLWRKAKAYCERRNLHGVSEMVFEP